MNGPGRSKLDKFLNLPSGWKYGKGEPLRKEVYTKAVNLYDKVEFLDCYCESFPFLEGNAVTLGFSGKKFNISFDIYADSIDLDFYEGSDYKWTKKSITEDTAIFATKLICNS